MATTINDFAKALHAALDATFGAMADNLWDERGEGDDFGYAENHILGDNYELAQPAADGSIRVRVGEHSTTLTVEQDGDTFYVLVPKTHDAPANDRGWSVDTMSTGDWVNLADWPFTVLEVTDAEMADLYEGTALFAGATYRDDAEESESHVRLAVTPAA